MEGLLILLGIIVVSVGLSLGISGIINLCYDVTEDKRKKAQ